MTLGLDRQNERLLTPKLDGKARRWLLAMQRCVRDRDYEAARDLFSAEVFSFGTLAPTADGIEHLEGDQWREIWSRTTGFTFELDRARSISAGDCVCVATPWRSLGSGSDGETFERRGRATLVLARSGDRLVAVHSHFSMWPVADR
jgi:ketosteroid isomerase-like protein